MAKPSNMDTLKKLIAEQKKKISQATIKAKKKVTSQSPTKKSPTKNEEKIPERKDKVWNFVPRLQAVEIQSGEESDIRKKFGETVRPIKDEKERQTAILDMFDFKKSKEPPKEAQKKIKKKSFEDAILYLDHTVGTKWGKNKFLRQVFILPLELQNTFIDGYLKQAENYAKYFSNWITTNEKQFEENTRRVEELLEKDRKRKEELGIFEDEEVFKPSSEEAKLKHTKRLDDVDTEVKRDKTPSPKAIKKAGEKYNKNFGKKNNQNYPWISKNVGELWIHTDDKNDEFINKAVFIEISDKKFYQPSKNYFVLMDNSSKISQKGTKVIVRDLIGNKYKFVVGYTIPKNEPTTFSHVFDIKKDSKHKLIIQDESVFESQQKWFEDAKDKELEAVKKILVKKIDKTSIHIASTSLSFALTNIAPKVKEYKNYDNPDEKESDFIKEVIDIFMFESENNGELFEKVANITVYLNMSECKIFHERIVKFYYTPAVLTNLSPVEKFPEVFSETSGLTEQYQAVVSSNIIERIKKMVFNMGVDYFKSTTLSGKLSKLILENESKVVPTFVYDSDMCIDVDGKCVPPEKVVFYKDKDDGKKYKFNIDTLIENFNKGDFKNPISGKAFDPMDVVKWSISLTTDKETVYWSLKEIYDRFNNGNFMIPNTTKPFPEKFIKNFLEEDKPYEVILTERQKSLQKYDIMLGMCKNWEDIKDENVYETVQYKDPSDNNIYCFTIKNVAKILNENKKNPYTNKPFSEKFVEMFTSTYRIPEDNVLSQDKKEKKKKEEKKLVIPDIWKIVVSEYEKMIGVKFGMNEDESESEDEGEETDEESEESEDESEDESEEDEKDSESREDRVSTVITPVIQTDNKSPQAKANFSFSSKPCQKCGGEAKMTSIHYVHGKPEPIDFCSGKCLDGHKFHLK